MKRLVCTTLWILLAATFALSADVVLQWDPRPAGDPTPWLTVRIYEVQGTNYVLVKEVTGDLTQATLNNVTPGQHTYVARSVNIWESANSNTAATPAQPSPPGSFRTVTVTVVVQ